MPALPTGTIALWYGSVASIPSGFVLCDGTLGTPDLRDKFIIGAGGAHAPAATGGAVQHNHSFTGDGHDHYLPSGTQIAYGENYDRITSLSNASGTTDNTNHLPPYHALCYIMKT